MGSPAIRDWMDGSPDVDLIDQSRTDPAAFTEVFDRHFAVIHAYLERRAGRDRADDLAAETFRVAFQQRARYRPLRESALPWLYGIASNLLLRDRRAEARRLQALARLDGEARDSEAAADRAGERADAEALRRPLFAALAGLEPRDRDVLVLVAWEELSYVEVAEALGIPIGTVRSRLNRARRQIQRALPESVAGGQDA
jgi:RNA polymerase sigma factor (sigma-70 family)